MTKMKSKKMTKSTFAVIIMAIVMVAMMAFGGTYAYFTANAKGESIVDIKTAKLELANMSHLTYASDVKEIVPGDYIFGDGTLDGTVDWAGVHASSHQTIDLELEGTNAAVYAFVRVTTLAYTGADVKSAVPLMVKTGDTTFAPVLKLIPHLNTVDIDDTTTIDPATKKPDGTGGTPYKTGEMEAKGWGEFAEGDGVGVNKSTYIYYFEVDDTKVCRDAFNAADFHFSLQFDYRVHADRTQVWDDKNSNKVVEDGEVTFAETTNVYKLNAAGTGVEGEAVPIMDVNIYFKMEFAIVQQLGFNTPQDACKVAFTKVNERGDKVNNGTGAEGSDNKEDGYTDFDMDPSTPAA